MNKEMFGDVIGLTLTEAQTKHPGTIFRALDVDGEARFGTMEMRMNRVNVSLKEGKITSIIKLG